MPTRSARAVSRSASATMLSSRPRRCAHSGSPVRGLPGPDGGGVARERRRPRHRRVVAGVGQVTVQGPQAADEPLRVGGHRFGDVPALWRDRTHDGHRASGSAERDDVAGALVERRQRRAEPGGVALLGRERTGPGCELAQRLRPSRRGVRDDHGGHPLVAEELRHGHPRVDAGLARHHRHVRGIGDHDRPGGESATRPRILELGELGDDVGHLVAAFAAADVDDDVGGAPLRDLLQQNGLPCPEAARHRGGAAERDRVQQVQHALPRHQRLPAVEPGPVRPRPAHRPPVRHGQLEPVDRGDRFVVGVLAGSNDMVDRPRHRRWDQESHPHRLRARDVPDRAARLRLVADEHGRREEPSPRPARGGPTGDEPRACVGEGTQQAVEHPAEQAGTQGGGERLTGRHGGVPRPKAPGVLVGLHRRRAVRDAHHLPGEPTRPELDDLGHRRLAQSVDLDQGAVDPPDASRAGRSVGDRSPVTATTGVPSRDAAVRRCRPRVRPACTPCACRRSGR